MANVLIDNAGTAKFKCPLNFCSWPLFPVWRDKDIQNSKFSAVISKTEDAGSNVRVYGNYRN